MRVLSEARGHGELGLRPSQKLFEELIDLPIWDKRVLSTAEAAVIATTWTLDQGDTYSTPFSQSYDDIGLDVVSVKSTLDPLLVRVETLVACRATPGSYFYDFLDPLEAGLERWDDGVTLWDGAISVWDQNSSLYVHLEDGSDPNATTVVAGLGFFFSNKGTVHPNFGPEKLLNGDFEASVDFEDWVLGAGNAALTIETTDPIRELKSARWDLSAVTLNFRLLGQTFEGVAGGFYRLSALYSILFDGMLTIGITTPSGTFIRKDGRHTSASIDNSTQPFASTTNGVTRRLTFDFLATESGTYTLNLIGNAADNPTGPASWDDAVTLWDDAVTEWDNFGLEVPVVLVDSVSLRRVYRYNYFEPRITSRSTSTVSSGSRDIYFEATQMGQGTIALLNGDGYFDSVLELFDWIGQRLDILAGGAFQDGEDLLIDDFRSEFRGIVRQHPTTDNKASFSMEDTRSLILQEIPENLYTILGFPAMDPARVGFARPIWFGPQENITPTRIELVTNDFGRYELADASVVPNGIVSIDEIRAFTTSQAAGEKDLAQSLVLLLGTDYSVDIATARFAILADVQVIEITEENNAVDFTRSGPKAGFIIPGFYTPRLLAPAVQAAMELADPARTYVTVYSESLNTFTITRGGGGGAFVLTTQGGPNKKIAAWAELGFDQSFDHTGAAFYTSDFPIYADNPDEQHFLRVDGVGARDTVPGGDFTGVSGDPIQKGTDIVRTIWSEILRQPAVLIDESSFVDARTSAPEPLGVYLDQVTDVRTAFQAIGVSNFAQIPINGSGEIFYFVNVPGAIPAGTQVLDDADFMKFAIQKGIGDVYGLIRVLWGEDPSTGEKEIATATDEPAQTLFGRFGAKEFESFHTTGGNAVALASSLLAIAKQPPRIADFMVKGMLLDTLEGQKVILTRRRGVDDSGELEEVLFRILQIQKTLQSGAVQVAAVEDI